MTAVSDTGCQWFRCPSDATTAVLLAEREIGRLCDQHAQELQDTFKLYRLGHEKRQILEWAATAVNETPEPDEPWPPQAA